jgi:hypothetical protein
MSPAGAGGPGGVPIGALAGGQNNNRRTRARGTRRSANVRQKRGGKALASANVRDSGTPASAFRQATKKG